MIKSNFAARTDLAIETKERFAGTDTEIKGVIVEKHENEKGKYVVTSVKIENDNGARIMGKPKGIYITIEGNYSGDEESDLNILSREVRKQIKTMIGDRKKIMVIGLGNRDATPDALGPKTVEKLDFFMSSDWEVMALAPGVLSQTGMETASMIKGLVDAMKPEVVVAIDSLAAGSSKRLLNTIQITDTGISPGSGVGNHRNALCRESLGVDVIAIGIPTVIESSAIVMDTMDNLFSLLPLDINDYSDSEKHQLIKELLVPDIRDMYVTPKDIDSNINDLSILLADSLNNIWTKSI